VQIVAATNGDLEAMVRAGRFRDDLFYRLRVAPLHIPPLRERGDDVLLLAERFLDDLCAVYRLPRPRLAPEAGALVRRYRWPGNVRELRNTLDRALLFGDCEVIDPAALGLPGERGQPQLSLAAGDGLRFDIPDSGVRFEDVEKALILSALSKAGGSQSGAARLLGMTRDTLRYRMEKFGLEGKAEATRDET
jgi:DNA-binding NtrC family response regulator